MDRPASDAPLWLSHHRPDQHDRCIHLGDHLVCRRCLVLYPIVVATAGVLVAAGWSGVPASFALAAMWLLPLPMTLEWIGEELLGLAHSPRRLVVLSAIAAVGVGLALATHVVHPFAGDALAPMATHVTACAVASIAASRRRADAATAPAAGHSDGRPAWEVDHDRREAERRTALETLLVRADNERGRTE